MNARINIAFLMVLIAAVSCDHSKEKQTQASRKPASFREALFTSITPTSDGGAYAIGFDSGLWYIRGTEAVKVRFSDVPTNNPDTFFSGWRLLRCSMAVHMRTP